MRAARKFDAYLRGAKGSKDGKKSEQMSDRASGIHKSTSAEGTSRKAKSKQSVHIEHSESIVRALQKAAEVLIFPLEVMIRDRQHSNIIMHTENAICSHCQSKVCSDLAMCLISS